MSEVLKNGISMVLLSYKEEENLRVFLPQIREKLRECGEPYEIVVIDSMEPLDDSKKVCEENGVRYVNQEEAGFGGAFRTGIRYAEYRKFFIMDSDGSHNPVYIPDIYRIFMAERADVAIGSRYTEGGVNNDSITSQIMSHILNTVYGFVLGIHAKDMSTDFRLYHTCRLKEVEPELICKNYDVLQEVLLKLKLKKQARGKKLKVVETPITFDKRLFGNSKRRLIAFIISYMKSVFYLGWIRLKAVSR
ncbi:MAG: glycosyltransferase [Lachnospiraceae bacterium]|nr:glycosyltransferase [Lachnospiraceae bacterium]